MGRVYAYARISKKTQKMERQIENLTKACPDARLYIDTMVWIRARVGTLSRNSYYKYKRELFEQIALAVTYR